MSSFKRTPTVLAAFLGALAAVAVAGYLVARDSSDRDSTSAIPHASTEKLTGIAAFEAELARSRVRVAAWLLEQYRRERGSGYVGATPRVLQQLADHEPLHVKVVRVTKTAYCIEARTEGAVASKSGPWAAIIDSPCPS